jgi:putative tricarboxylic transport membrane protein
MEIVFDLFIALVLVGFIVGGTMISADTVASDLLGAGGFPILFAVFALVLLGLNFLQRFRTKPEPQDHGLTSKGLMKAAFIALSLFVYILVLMRLGFMISTLVLGFAVVRLVGYEKNLKALLFSFLLTAALVIVFGKIFYIALPRGVGFIKELSFFIY